MVSTSLKQVGKSKSSSIIRISKDKKETLIEPAFDFWFRSPKALLKEKEVVKMSLEEWLASRT